MDLGKLEEVLGMCVYKLSKNRVWTGTDYNYLPLPKERYLPVIEELEGLLHELANGN